MAKEKQCTDKKCPFHGNIKLRGKSFTGVVLAKDTHNTATVEWSYPVVIPKYERSETRRTKIHVHNPSCLDADIGDIVKVQETRPLSKTKKFVIVENMGKKKGFIEELAAREEATVEGAEEPEIKKPQETPEETKKKDKTEEDKETEPKEKEANKTKEKKEKGTKEDAKDSKEAEK
ncbi:30S ribosomal protein S17 [Candidatus Woesearchaeota archaeon]|nr:30S ribosomal protein S17 [Candidatus Woesearchaeota archaeon]